MAKSSRPRRASKAQMARTLRELEAQAAQPRELPGPIAELIDTYTSPHLGEAQLPEVRAFMRTVLIASSIQGAASAQKHRTHLSGLAAFALARGLSLHVPEVMTTDLIDEYIRRGMPAATDALRAERRRRLLNLAREVNPGPQAPATMTPISHQAIHPCYTPTELTVIARVAATQPTPARQRGLAAVVALGAGAGADSIDLRPLRVENIENLGSDGWQVHFQDPRPRIVPVRARFDTLVARAVAGRAGHELLIGTKADRRNTAAQVIGEAAVLEGPPIEPARLRATWLADLMTDVVPLGVILRAAGLKSARSLADLLPHLEPWLMFKNLDQSSLEALRGGAR